MVKLLYFWLLIEKCFIVGLLSVDFDDVSDSSSDVNAYGWVDHDLFLRESAWISLSFVHILYFLSKKKKSHTCECLSATAKLMNASLILFILWFINQLDNQHKVLHCRSLYLDGSSSWWTLYCKSPHVWSAGSIGDGFWHKWC